jgi:hypothetical protein
MKLANRVRFGVEAATLDAVSVGGLTKVWEGRSETGGAVLKPSVVKTKILEGKQ